MGATIMMSIIFYTFYVIAKSYKDIYKRALSSQEVEDYFKSISSKQTFVYKYKGEWIPNFIDHITSLRKGVKRERIRKNYIFLLRSLSLILIVAFILSSMTVLSSAQMYLILTSGLAIIIFIALLMKNENIIFRSC